MVIIKSVWKNSSPFRLWYNLLQRKRNTSVMCMYDIHYYDRCWQARDPFPVLGCMLMKLIIHSLLDTQSFKRGTLVIPRRTKTTPSTANAPETKISHRNEPPTYDSIQKDPLKCNRLPSNRTCICNVIKAAHKLAPRQSYSANNICIFDLIVHSCRNHEIPLSPSPWSFDSCTQPRPFKNQDITVVEQAFNSCSFIRLHG